MSNAEILRQIFEVYEDRGWRETGGAALAVMEVLTSPKPTLGRLKTAIPSRFLVQNSAKRDDVANAMARLLP